MKITEADRRLLARLGAEPQSLSTIATALDRSSDDLGERLAALADNGLVRDCGDDRYCRTESGRRLLRTAGGRLDEAIDTDQDVEDAIADIDLGPEGEDAVRAAYAFLRYWGEASGDELIDAIYPEWPAGMTSPEDWWERIGSALADVPAVVRVDDHAGQLELWRYAGTPEVATPGADGFLPAERRGRRHFGSVTHAIESLDLTADERLAVRMAFAALRRRGTASQDEIGAAAFEDAGAGFETAEQWWAGLVADAFEQLPGVTRVDDDRWRYDLPPTD